MLFTFASRVRLLSPVGKQEVMNQDILQTLLDEIPAPRSTHAGLKVCLVLARAK